MKATSMIPVLPGYMQGQPTQLVDARLLHQFLQVGRDFSNWIKGRIQEYAFEENKDYLLAKTGEQLPHLGGLRTVVRIDYFLSIDMSKELAMVERTPRGRQARRYFIECERQLRMMQGKLSLLVQSQQHVLLSRAQRQAINRQAWADVAGDAHAAFHARREALIKQIGTATGWNAGPLVRLTPPAWALVDVSGEPV